MGKGFILRCGSWMKGFFFFNVCVYIYPCVHGRLSIGVVKFAEGE